jgi:hypothetical protein
MLGRILGRNPAGPSSPATIEAEKRAAVETAIGRAAIVSNLTMAASAVGALQVPVISGSIAGLILLVAHVYGSANKQSKLQELLVRIERQLLFAYYQFKVIEEAAKSANVSIDTKRVADAIESVRTAITSTLGDKNSRDKNIVNSKSSRLTQFGQTLKNVLVASISDLVTYEKIIMTEVEQLRN